MRVGHTITHIQSKDTSNRGRLCLIGGANPSCCFNDVFFFNLDNCVWEKLSDSKCLNTPRYEHSAFVDNYAEAAKILVFGGAGQEQNFNDVQSFDLASEKWSVVNSLKGANPEPRTQHNGCVFRNQLVVFSGGEVGATPVSDADVHIFNEAENTWTRLTIDGQVPNGRHGHLMLNFNDKCIYMHGGMSNGKFFSDLWILDIDDLKWSKVKQPQTNMPASRAAHGGISSEKYLYIFGGLDEDANALGDFWSLNVETNSWSKVNISGDNPTPRLDFAYCKMVLKKSFVKEEAVASLTDQEVQIEIDRPKLISVFEVAQSDEGTLSDDTKYVLNNTQVNQIESSEINSSDPTTCNSTKMESTENFALQNLSVSEAKSTTQEEKCGDELTFFVIHGGMDTIGNIFDDCFLISLE